MTQAVLILAWSPGEAEADAAASQFIHALPDGARIQQRAGLLILDAHENGVKEVAPSIFLLGDVFSGASVMGEELVPRMQGEEGFETYCDLLLRRCWGDYLVLHHVPGASAHLSAFVEPMGRREWTEWIHRGVQVLTCDAEKWLGLLPPADLAIDEAEVAHLIQYPETVSDTCPLKGLVSLPPGAITRLDRSLPPRSRRLWRPRDYSIPSARPADAATLLGLVDDCVAAWAKVAGRSAIEVSGGLDSAIVASSLVQAAMPPLHAMSFFSEELAGDERRFSRAIAEHLAIPTREFALLPQAIGEDMLSSLATGLRPGIGSTTLFHDARLSNACRAIGATSLFTGRGGDALFFQHPTPLVAAGRWAPGQDKSVQSFETLARWCRCSIWSVARHALLPSGKAMAHNQPGNRFASPISRPRPSLWAGPLDGLSPAKQMQVRAISGDRGAFGASRCAQDMRVVHPLLSQPLVEFALGQSLMTLTARRRDRALVRAAFAHRLPQVVTARRGKGALTSFFGRSLARSTALLRAYLLDGSLARAGLVDRHALEKALAPEYLVQTDCYTELLALITVEAWMRDWQRRLQQGAQEQVA